MWLDYLSPGVNSNQLRGSSPSHISQAMWTEIFDGRRSTVSISSWICTSPIGEQGSAEAGFLIGLSTSIHRQTRECAGPFLIFGIRSSSKIILSTFGGTLLADTQTKPRSQDTIS